MQILERRGQCELVNQHAGVDTFCKHLLTSKQFGVTTKENVNTTTGHVGRNSDCSDTTSLSNNLCFTCVLLGIQHFVANSTLGEFARQVFALLNADCSDQDGLAKSMALHNVFDNCAKLCNFRLIDEVWLINTQHCAVCRNGHHLQVIGVHKLCCFGLSRTCHAGQLVVHAEIVLQRDGGESLVLFVDTKIFFRFNSLVNTFTPATTLKHTARELVNDLYFACINDVILVSAIQLFGFQRNGKLMHEVLLN